MKTSIRVRVPATTANVGPGFDTLGIALQLYNAVDLELLMVPQIKVDSQISLNQSRDSMKMVMEASKSFFHRTGMKKRGLMVRISGDVPTSRGLGSSVTVRLGIIAGLNHLFGRPLKKHDILEIVGVLEGHPDNAAPAIYGGLAVSGMLGNRMACLHKKLPEDLKFVAAVPDFEVETRKARELLPSSLSLADVVHNVNRVALLTAALWSGNYGIVGDFLDDRLHQPYRATLVPQLFQCLNAAKTAGAIGGWLSGSGSTVMALTYAHEKLVGEAMQRVFKGSARSCRVLIMKADCQGVTFGKIRKLNTKRGIDRMRKW